MYAPTRESVSAHPSGLSPTSCRRTGGVRFTQRDGVVYAVLLETSLREFGIRGLDASVLTGVRWLSLDESLTWAVTDGQLRVTTPERLPVAPAYVLGLGTAHDRSSQSTFDRNSCSRLLLG